jgi:hypothetical protein
MGSAWEGRQSPSDLWKRVGAVICSPSFHTSTIRNVPESEKHAVEIEYGMTPRSYGRTIEIDHIVSLELGGSNDITNLFPESGAGGASYHVKDKLENRLHNLVCGGSMSPRVAPDARAGRHRISNLTATASHGRCGPNTRTFNLQGVGPGPTRPMPICMDFPSQTTNVA